MKASASAAILSIAMQIAHFTRFQVRGEDAEPVIQARRVWTSACQKHERFRGGLLVALELREWLEISVWDQPHRSPGRDEDAPPIDFLERVDGPGIEILGQEAGRVANGQWIWVG